MLCYVGVINLSCHWSDSKKKKKKRWKLSNLLAHPDWANDHKPVEISTLCKYVFQLINRHRCELTALLFGYTSLGTSTPSMVSEVGSKKKRRGHRRGFQTQWRGFQTQIVIKREEKRAQEGRSIFIWRCRSEARLSKVKGKKHVIGNKSKT